MDTEIIIFNGSGLPVNGGEAFEWLYISDGKIADLGIGDGYKVHQSGTVKWIDAKGGSILPGFIDSHFHVVQASLNSRSIDLHGARSFDDIGESILRAVQEHPGQAIRGIRLDQQALKENRMPDRMTLDSFCADVPIFINSIEYQTSALNTYALLYYKIPFTLEGICYDANQVPTGVITKQANMILRENILKAIPDSKRLEAVTELVEQVLRKGITTVNAMEGGRLYSDKDAEFIYEYKDRLAVDTVLFFQSMDIDRIKNLGLPRIGGSLYVDGTFGARTSALSIEYADAPGIRGGLNFTQDELNQFVLDCYRNQLQLALYTIGDRAIEQAVRAHEYALDKTGCTGLRHRLEHVELPTEDHIARAKELGLVFSMSPSYELIWGGRGSLYEVRLGDWYKKTNPFRQIFEAGVLMCGGSDCDVTPADPILGIHAAVNHPVSEHQLPLMEAIKMFTINGAYAIFEEDRKGTLERGKMADVVVLDRDILKVPQETIKDILVTETIKSGEIVVRRPGLFSAGAITPGG